MNQYEAAWNVARANAEIHGLRIVEHGWEQHVIIDAEGGLIYRYPRHKAAAAKLKDEVKVLETINHHTWPVEIPKLLEYNGIFATYKYIPGEVLTPDRVLTLTKTESENIGKGLGEFLAQLHKLDHEVVLQKETSHSTELLEYYSDRIKNSDAPYKNKAEAALDKLISLSSDTKRVVLHGDLHGLNVVVNASTNELRGVIDLSEIELGDPHQEFRKIYMTFADSLEATINSYQANGGTKINPELVIYWAYVNEWANLCYFYNNTQNLTYQRAYQHLLLWEQL